MNLLHYTSPRNWLRNLWKGSVHAGVGSVLTVVGTNGAESLAPTMLNGVGLDLRQMVAVFAASAIIEALRRIHQATQDTTPPFPIQTSTPPSP